MLHVTRPFPTTLAGSLLLRGVLIALLSVACFGQRLFVESDTLEGQLLQRIDEEKDAAMRLKLLNEFARQFPNHEAAPWVYSQLQTESLEKKEFDRVLELTGRILRIEPDNVVAAHNALRASEGKKDLQLVKTWSVEASKIARKVISSAKPEDADEIEDWKARVEFARQVDQYTEYALYFIAVQSKDTKTKVEFIAALEQRNPSSEYLPYMRIAQTRATRQVDINEAVVSAEQNFKNGQYTADELMLVATYYMQRRKEYPKIVTYSMKLVDLLNSGAGKPEDVSDAEWVNRKQNMLGTAYWMAGLVLSTQEKYAQADRLLRSAIPLVKNLDMLAGAFYHLGYANYRLAEAGERIRIHEAIKFMLECQKIPSAVQHQAGENLKAIKAEYALQD